MSVHPLTSVKIMPTFCGSCHHPSAKSSHAAHCPPVKFSSHTALPQHCCFYSCLAASVHVVKIHLFHCARQTALPSWPSSEGSWLVPTVRPCCFPAGHKQSGRTLTRHSARITGDAAYVPAEFSAQIKNRVSVTVCFPAL